ncbi:MAG: GNAT family N-acetyltransferase [Pseudomonadota bacterium]
MLELDRQATEADAAVIEMRLLRFADRFTGPRAVNPYRLAFKDTAGRVQGGVVGETLWDWLQIGSLWVDERYRGQGYGGKLLRAAEMLGRERGCRHARLSTWEFEARDFYEAHGYRVYGQCDGIPAGHTQYFLRKALTTPES